MTRRGIGWLVILGALLLGLRPAQAAPPEPQKVTPAAVDDAIAAGVGFLLESQRPDGAFGTGGSALGRTSLAVFALLHAGLREDQRGRPAGNLRRAFRFLDRHGPGRAGKRDVDPGTYTTALLLLLLRERDRPIDRARMQRLVDLLVRTQSKNGQWWYYGRPGKTGKTGGDTGDNSNTQFAVLALAAARGAGMVVPDATLTRAQGWWHSAQKADGSFGYASGGSAKSASSASMTAAGLACMAALEACLVPPRVAPPPHPPGIRKAVAWMEAHFSVVKNHGPTKGGVRQRQKNAGRGWLHYYLWTLERAFVLTELEHLGPHDWYAEGAAQLLATQREKDGSWRGEHPLYATSFALLFLTRAADPPRAFTNPTAPSPPAQGPDPVVTGPRDPKPGAGPPEEQDPDKEPAVEVVPSGTIEDWLELSLPPGELARRCRLAGAHLLRPLVTFLQAPDKVQRQRAWEALLALLPAERLFRADRHPLPRGRLLAWLRRNAHVLRLSKGRFQLPPAGR